MTTIVLPIWTIAAFLMVPSLCLLGVSLHQLKNRRRTSNPASRSDDHGWLFGMDREDRFQKDLFALQIDAVFNALTALVETERVKLKTLLCRNYPSQLETPADMPTPLQKGLHQNASNGLNIHQQIAQRAVLGETTGDIANALDLSKSEVELALSIHPVDGTHPQKRLEAVA